MEVLDNKAAIGASTSGIWSNATSSGAILKNHLSVEEGIGADPGVVHSLNNIEEQTRCKNNIYSFAQFQEQGI